MSEKIDIKSMTLEELTDFLAEWGEKSFRAKQIYEWLHVKQVTSFADMTNLSKVLRERLKQECELVVLHQEMVQISKLDGTRKYLFALSDGNMIESVLMKYKHGNSVCVSSQVGCRMGCRFCASTIDGMIRNLTTSEILDQIYRISADIGERISNVVVMGSGEPMDNYDNIVKFIRMVSDERGVNISQRNLTVSTCGIVPRMLELAEENFQITLALSLHASSQEKRQELMPIANRYQLSEVLKACKVYFEKTGRRITFEYSLVGGVNDSDEDVERLCGLVRGINCHINLIPVNPIKERSYVQSSSERIQAFQHKLEKNGVNATVRREMGRDIDGACGQLRRNYKNKQTE